ncbi:diguanylate cyclase [Pseudomonas putida]|nr:diguanylate cyclase [Pseudomonas putida]
MGAGVPANTGAAGAIRAGLFAGMPAPTCAPARRTSTRKPATFLDVTGTD